MKKTSLPPEWRERMAAYQERMVALQTQAQADGAPPPALPIESPAVLLPPAQLQVRASTGAGALPVADALVRVYTEKGEEIKLRYAVRTDADGLSPVLALQGENPADTQSPGSAVPQQQYRVQIDKAGYYSQLHEHIVLYAGIRSRQTAELVPLPDGVVDAPIQIFDSQRPQSG